jgi:molecular chaperone GrpE
MSHKKHGAGKEFKIPVETERNEPEPIVKDNEADIISALKIENEKLKSEIAEVKDKHLRLFADFENSKKRQLRIFDDMVSAAQDGTILKILEIIDNFERAILSHEKDADPKAILQGVRLIHKQLLDLISAQGYEQICPDGECFDPNYHEAITALPSESEENTVIDTIQKGYKRADRLIRPAKVIVSKGSEKE